MAAYDYVLVGGGLQNGLIALAILDRRPDARLALIERAPRLGGNHTWSFHEATLPDGWRRWMGELVDARWDRYRVRFPGLEREVPHAYATISSARFHEVLSARFARAPHASLWLGHDARDVTRDRAELDTGEVLSARLVVDARGPEASATPRTTGWQTFLGLEVELDAPIDDTICDLIDATVDQVGGFRFFYVLPLSPTRALIEDTRFADAPELDEAATRAGVLRYAAERGMRVSRTIREERGALPMPWRASCAIRREPPLLAGYQGGWFHPATGYSVPVAARLAAHVAAHGPDDVFGEAYAALADAHEEQVHFAHLLNELLFTACKPEGRWQVFEHFYALPEAVMLRFYGATMRGADRRKMFFRRPPKGVSFLKAMRILPAWAAPWRR